MICPPPNTPYLFPCPLGQGCIWIYPVQKFPRAQYTLYHWLIHNVLPNDSNLAILPEVKLFTKIALLQKILDTPVYYLINVLTLFRDNSHIKCSLMLKLRRKKKKKKLILHLSISQIAQAPNRLIFISYTCQLIIFG